MKIGIIGTRGIPNHYGGFEQFAEYLSLGLVERGHNVTVYNSNSHPYQKDTWRGVNLVHCYDPEDKIGTAGQFIYDLNCIIDSRKKNFDIILQLGYTSSSVWGWLLPKKRSIITTNVDGLEWKRSKFSPKVRRFLKYAEKLGIKYSDYLISDSIGIQNYLSDEYGATSLFIPYGADLFISPDKRYLDEYNVKEYSFNMLIARLEPENSIETILDGAVLANSETPFLVIGKHDSKFGEYLKNKFYDQKNILFLGGIYNIDILNSLRHYSNLYFHGHTVGGTNPSLLEAMASQSLVVANDNIFNRSILGDDAFYFKDSLQISNIIKEKSKVAHPEIISSNEQKIINTYSWNSIIDQYEKHFLDILTS